jgi:hypothetical protein
MTNIVEISPLSLMLRRFLRTYDVDLMLRSSLTGDSTIPA